MAPGSRGSSRSALAALLVLALGVCFARLGAAPVYVLNEAREGVYARAMLSSGNFVLPGVPNHVENGVTLPDKPPLLHWIDCAGRALRSRITGQPLTGEALAGSFDAWDLRLGSALAALGCVLMLATLGRGLVGARAALLAALVLLTSAQFEHQAHFGRVDMCLAACIALTLLCLGRALLEGSRVALLGAALGSAGAVLAKGPLGIVLPGCALAAYLALRSWQEKGLGWLPRLPWLAAALLWALIALPWYWAAWRQGGQDFVRSQLLSENVAQFGGGNGRMALFAYLQPWLLDTFPWNLVALAGVRRAWREQHAGARFASVCWLALLFFFQVAAYKRRAYLLPAVPLEALLAGYALDGWLARAEALGARPQIGAAFLRLAGVAGLALVAGAGAGAWLAQSGRVPHWGAAPLAEREMVLGCATAGAALALAALALAAWRARRAHEALAALFLGSAAVVSGVLPVERIARARAADVSGLVSRIERELPPDRNLTLIGVGNDPSLVLLFAAREPQRWRVVPEAAAPLQEYPAGWYLVHQREARALAAGAARRGEAWREVLRGRMAERDNPRELVLLEHVRETH